MGAVTVCFIAWVAWLFIHLLFLVGFRSKVSVLMNWAYSYLAFRRSTRLIVNIEETILGRALLAHAPESMEGSLLLGEFKEEEDDKIAEKLLGEDHETVQKEQTKPKRKILKEEPEPA